MTPLPNTPLGLIEELEELYPPRCYDPTQGSLEAHLHYAGKVALIARLRERLEATNKAADKLPNVLS